MMTIERLFGKSPFAPLQTHMKRVASCIEKLTALFDILPKMELDRIERLAKELCNLEQDADQTKNDIRNHLPKSLFLPIDRTHFLEILSIQDSLADKAEDIGILLSFQNLEMHEELYQELTALYQKSIETFWHAKKIIEEIDELLESSFGGLEAEKVKHLVEETSFKEHETRLLQRKLFKLLLTHEPALTTSVFYQWERVVRELGAIAEIAERLANHIRMILELK